MTPGRAGLLAAAMLAALGGVARPVAAAGRPVAFASTDGTPLAAALYEAPVRPAPAVVLVHMFTRSRADWDAFASRLQARGVTALALDLRGHGGSGGSPEPSRAMAGDIRAAVAWLSARSDVRSIAVVGASLGANLAALAAVDAPDVRGIALLSPSLDYRGVRIDAAVLRKMGDRPVFLAASVHDPYALRSIRDLIEGDPGPVEQRFSDAAAHGTALLAADPAVDAALVDWLRRTLVF
ncbi:MAG: alpha/beta fold hydrolase [Vicinamibacterales bacterium]